MGSYTVGSRVRVSGIAFYSAGTLERHRVFPEVRIRVVLHIAFPIFPLCDSSRLRFAINCNIVWSSFARYTRRWFAMAMRVRLQTRAITNNFETPHSTVNSRIREKSRVQFVISTEADVYVSAKQQWLYHYETNVPRSFHLTTSIMIMTKVWSTISKAYTRSHEIASERQEVAIRARSFDASPVLFA